jgi:polar amino acid transport system substrate-binding protein
MLKSLTCLNVISPLILIPVIAIADTVKFITVDWPPFFAGDLPKGGFTVEIARQALSRKGHKMTITFAPWKRAAFSTRKGEYHGLFGCWLNDEYRTNFNASEEVMANGDGHFLALQGDNYYNLRPENILGKRVGIVRGYAVSETLEALFASGQVTRIEVNRVTQLLNMIQLKDRIDLILENESVIKYNFKRSYPGRVYNLEVVGKDYIDGGLYICWSQNHKDSDKFRLAFDEAIREMRKDGSLERIQAQFDITPPPPSLNLLPPRRN